ncbi:hypothetical protein JWG45_04965 [Leptospira sp. 201903070]|uniref:GtrA-like protein domain-containing protein n=1 Tax=Leptospira ainlahdjerensis TaxID=2810033 RepID=A0ABS2U811_9LEPT|nr:hypothetical protein [Leptospira ainlahdjerensis]MBM9576501.1 hypothetical protein [Leptospira ainlahdjerensis]
MKTQKKIALADSVSAFIAGAFTLIFSSFLCEWYRWPLHLILFIGMVNMLYGFYSGFISFRFITGNLVAKEIIILLIIANSLWGGYCLTQIFYLQSSSSILGLLHLGFEAIYVLGLAYWEAKILLPNSKEE